MWSEVSDCELIALYAFLGKKWTIPLLHNISDRPISFNDLSRITKHMINPTLLSNRLKGMVSFGIIRKEDSGDKTVYVLSKKGEELKTLMHEIKHWAIDNDYRLPPKCKSGVCVCSDIFKQKTKLALEPRH